MTSAASDPSEPVGATFWQAARAAALAARSSGALQPIETRDTTIVDGAIRFVVREVSSLLKKFAQQRHEAPQRNPFLPYEDALYVSDLGDRHVAILNKFPVVGEHVLVITRAFVPQDALIDEADLAAVATIMAERPVIAFYNAGRVAGASQPHRHLQVVPLPLGGAPAGTPIDAVLARLRGRSGLDAAPGLGFSHALEWLDPAAFSEPAKAGAMLFAAYGKLLQVAGIEGIDDAGIVRQSRPYNLLATREWMLLVPRLHERHEGIAVNALGFAGALFVRDDAQLATVTRIGPRAVLAAVAG